MSKPWYLYILECTGGRLYTGIALDPKARYKVHAEGRGAKFTRSYPPVRLAMVEAFANRSEASKAEYAIKKLSASEKRKLVGKAQR
ncbi:MAG: GIY-YIG nuclease family protein [Parvibaculum sp.]|nr:GIY-YIG nuclease family protein [Parvibaculum sp.]MDZ4366042.1 GIY-YIG nuclease family protein [Afipia sp.]